MKMQNVRISIANNIKFDIFSIRMKVARHLIGNVHMNIRTLLADTFEPIDEISILIPNGPLIPFSLIKNQI